VSHRKTSKRVGTIASNILRDPHASKNAKSAVRISSGESASWQAKVVSEMQLVLIEWLDSYGYSSQWQPLQGCHAKPLLCRSVGWLLHDGSDCEVVVPHMSDEINENVPIQGCGDMTIPTTAIISITELSPQVSVQPFKNQSN
jgi:hypothetical protein